MTNECCVEIDTIETLTSNIDMIDTMLLNQALTAGKNNILIVDSRDITFHLKKLCYDSSFAIPGYDLDDKFKNMMRSGINGVYLLEHQKMNDLALYFINNGISVGILKDVDNKAILRMNKKEIEMIEMAEQQLTGFAAGAGGESVEALAGSMGLTANEWEQIKSRGNVTLSVNDEKALDVYFRYAQRKNQP